MQGFIQDIFLFSWEEEGECRCVMCTSRVSVHPLDFKFWTYLIKASNIRFSYNKLCSESLL